MPKTASVSLESIETDFSTELIEIELPGGTRGLQGEQGIQGETGETPQFHVGSVTDTDEAEVSITGTKNDPVLNMGLPRGKSGVWVGETPPDNEQYKVWINPEETGSTIPTKVSDLTNDVGYITTNDIPKDVYSYQETLTNKVYIDSNNVQHPVYRKMIDVDFENLIDIEIEGTVKGIAHGISNLDKVTLEEWALDENLGGVPYKTANQGFIYSIIGPVIFYGQYIIFLNPTPEGIFQLTVEYTKTN